MIQAGSAFSVEFEVVALEIEYNGCCYCCCVDIEEKDKDERVLGVQVVERQEQGVLAVQEAG
jgi:hypothetical protein